MQVYYVCVCVHSVPEYVIDASVRLLTFSKYTHQLGDSDSDRFQAWSELIPQFSSRWYLCTPAPPPHIVVSVNLSFPAFPHAVPQASNCHVSEPTFPNTHLSPTLCVQFHEVSLAPGGRAWRCAAELGHRWHLRGREMCRHVSWPGQLQLWHLSVW